MTIQLKSPQFNKSKAVLEAALNAFPSKVYFEDPSIFEGSRGEFTGEGVQPNTRFAVVMDPLTRRRFATVHCRANGQFRVS